MKNESSGEICLMRKFTVSVVFHTWLPQNKCSISSFCFVLELIWSWAREPLQYFMNVYKSIAPPIIKIRIYWWKKRLGYWQCVQAITISAFEWVYRRHGGKSRHAAFRYTTTEKQPSRASFVDGCWRPALSLFKVPICEISVPLAFKVAAC